MASSVNTVSSTTMPLSTKAAMMRSKAARTVSRGILKRMAMASGPMPLKWIARILASCIPMLRRLDRNATSPR